MKKVFQMIALTAIVISGFSSASAKEFRWTFIGQDGKMEIIRTAGKETLKLPDGKDGGSTALITTKYNRKRREVIARKYNVFLMDLDKYEEALTSDKTRFIGQYFSYQPSPEERQCSRSVVDTNGLKVVHHGFLKLKFDKFGSMTMKLYACDDFVKNKDWRQIIGDLQSN